MPNVTAGSILIAQSTGEWVNEQNWELTGTVGVGDVPAPYQIYLGASASSTPNYYVGYYIVYSGMTSFIDSIVTAYNSTTKVATVSWTSTDSTPPVGRQWRCMIKFPVLSSYRWQRDGVDIPGEINRSYTTTAADIGKTISFLVVGGSVPQGTSPTAIVSPTVTSSNQGSPTYTVTGPAPSGNFIMSREDFTLLGAMRPYFQYVGGSINIVPASKSPSGQKCLYISAVGQYVQNATYMTLPTLTQDYSTTAATWSSFPPASICQIISNHQNIFDGKFGTGVQDASSVFGSLVIDSTYLLTSYVAGYSYQPMSVMVRRPTNLSTAGPVDLFVLYDPLQPNARWRSGAIQQVPAQYQSALGGDIIVAGVGLSIHSNMSQGPTAFVFNYSDIAPALAKANSGTSVSGNATTMVLASSANNTTNDYYKDCYLAVANGVSSRITAYNASTRTATVADPYLPTTSASYTVIPNVNGKTLIGYSTPFFASDAYGAIWDPAGTTSSAGNAIIVNNTKSFISVTNGAFGAWDYGISNTARPSGYGGGARLYNPYVASNGNADQLSHFFLENGAPAQLVVYNTDDMAAVASGSASYSSLTPKAIFSLPCPYKTLTMGGPSFFDNSDGKLYMVIDLAGPNEYAYPVILVYQCNKWS